MSEVLEETGDELVEPEAEAGAGEAEPEAPSAGEPEAEAEAAPAWAPPREEWEQVVAQNAEVARAITEARAQAEQAGRPDPMAELDGLDPFDDNYNRKVVETLGGILGGVLEQELAPLREIAAEREQQKSREQVDGWLTEATSPHGLGDDAKPLVEAMAFGFAVQNQVDGQTAVNQAATQYATALKAARQAGRDELKAELEAAAGRRGEPSSVGSPTRSAATYKDEEAAALAYVERRSG